MTEAPCRLAVVIPGLCRPALDTRASGYQTLSVPALERLLSRARSETQPASDMEQLLPVFFRLAGADAAALAVAPLTWLADTGNRATGFIMRADPVHLRADQARLRLFDSTTFALDVQEARDLVAAFNDHYRRQGWQLHAPVPQRWYLMLDEAPELVTVAPMRLAGRDISDGLPQGAVGAQWHAILNEVQMLFHDHPVNRAREQRGEPVVNSIWPWGGGYLPGQLQTPVSRVIASHPQLRGLAQLGEVPCQDVPGSAAELIAMSPRGLQLVWLDRLECPWRYDEVEAWSEGLRQLEQVWFQPLLESLVQGRIGGLDLYPLCGRRYRITRRRLRHFWRPGRSLAWHCNG